MITYIPAKPESGDLVEHWYNGTGWYWSDETESLNGPYETSDQAEQQQKDYADWLNG